MLWSAGADRWRIRRTHLYPASALQARSTTVGPYVERSACCHRKRRIVIAAATTRPVCPGGTSPRPAAAVVRALSSRSELPSKSAVGRLEGNARRAAPTHGRSRPAGRRKMREMTSPINRPFVAVPCSEPSAEDKVVRSRRAAFRSLLMTRASRPVRELQERDARGVSSRPDDRRHLRDVGRLPRADIKKESRRTSR